MKKKMILAAAIVCSTVSVAACGRPKDALQQTDSQAHLQTEALPQSQAGDAALEKELIEKNIKTVSSLKPEDIISISFDRYTEGGIVSESISDADTKNKIIQLFSDVILKGESSMGVDDDGLRLSIYTEDSDNPEYIFLFEGDVLVSGENRFGTEGISGVKGYIDALLEEKNS